MRYMGWPDKCGKYWCLSVGLAKGQCRPGMWGNSDSGEFLYVESGMRSIGIWNTAQGIRNTTNDWNPESKFQWQNLACVALRFWLGALSNKGGRGQRNHEVFVILAASPLVRLARQNCHATQANKNWNPVPGIRNPQYAIHNSGLSWITLHGTNSDAGFSRSEVRGRFELLGLLHWIFQILPMLAYFLSSGRWEKVTATLCRSSVFAAQRK